MSGWPRGCTGSFNGDFAGELNMWRAILQTKAIKGNLPHFVIHVFFEFQQPCFGYFPPTGYQQDTSLLLLHQILSVYSGVQGI